MFKNELSKRELVETFHAEQELNFQEVIRQINKEIFLSNQQIHNKSNQKMKRDFYYLKKNMLEEDYKDYSDINKKMKFLERNLKLYKKFVFKVSKSIFEIYHDEYKRFLLVNPKRSLEFKKFVEIKREEIEKEKAFSKERNLCLMKEFQKLRNEYMIKVEDNFKYELEHYQILMENSIMTATFDDAEFYRKLYQDVIMRFNTFKQSRYDYNKRAEKNYRYFLENVGIEDKVKYGEFYQSALINALEGNIVFQHFKEKSKYEVKIKQLYEFEKRFEGMNRNFNINPFRIKVGKGNSLKNLLNSSENDMGKRA